MADQAVRDSARVFNPLTELSPTHAIAADRVAARISRDVIATFIASGETAALNLFRREVRLAIAAAGAGRSGEMRS
jgi:hypothetical protein